MIIKTKTKKSVATKTTGFPTAFLFVFDSQKHQPKTLKKPKTLTLGFNIDSKTLITSFKNCLGIPNWCHICNFVPN